ncbi:hypothetical protein LTR48_008573, partial [Friedmanniomyces endolithicus]
CWKVSKTRKAGFPLSATLDATSPTPPSPSSSQPSSAKWANGPPRNPTASPRPPTSSASSTSSPSAGSRTASKCAGPSAPSPPPSVPSASSSSPPPPKPARGTLPSSWRCRFSPPSRCCWRGRRISTLRRVSARAGMWCWLRLGSVVLYSARTSSPTPRSPTSARACGSPPLSACSSPSSPS